MVSGWSALISRYWRIIGVAGASSRSAFCPLSQLAAVVPIPSPCLTRTSAESTAKARAALALKRAAIPALADGTVRPSPRTGLFHFPTARMPWGLNWLEMTKNDWDGAAYHRVSNPQFEWGLEVLGRLRCRETRRLSTRDAAP